MDPKIKCLYLAFNQRHTTMGQMTRYKYILEFFDYDDAMEFCSKFVKSGNHLYSEYMIQKTIAIKSKITNGDGIVI